MIVYCTAHIFYQTISRLVGKARTRIMSRELHQKGSRVKTTIFSCGFLRRRVHAAKLVVAIAIRAVANSTAAIAVLFAVALVLAVGNAVLVSVDVFGANMILS